MPRDYKRVARGAGAGSGREKRRADVRASSWRVVAMGKPTGFIEIQREKQPARPVEERVRDWNEVYLP